MLSCSAPRLLYGHVTPPYINIIVVLLIIIIIYPRYPEEGLKIDENMTERVHDAQSVQSGAGRLSCRVSE